ncbi:MAG: hypothetical protein J7K17_05295 [Candidatus Omnitrophica bacterium]|nr:hypothetical protein [Candidatus Omnitrophota bacterium]
MKDNFTLVEVMIVVGILVLLTALVVPNILRARITVNEVGAITSLKTIFSSAQIYKNINSVYPSSLGNLGDANPPYIEEELSCNDQPCSKQGYNFTLTGSEYSFYAVASPQNFGFTGIRSFYIDENGLVKYCDTADCDPSQGIILQE